MSANYKLPRAWVCTSGQAHKLWQIPLCVLLPQPPPAFTMCAQEPTDAHIAHTGLLAHHLYRWHSRTGVTTATARRTVHHMLGHPLDIGATRNSFGHPHSSGPWVSLAAAKRCRLIGFRHLGSRLRDRRMTMAPPIHVSHKSYGWPA